MSESKYEKLDEQRSVIAGLYDAAVDVSIEGDLVAVKVWASFNSGDDPIEAKVEPSSARELARRLLQAAVLTERERDETERKILGSMQAVTVRL